MDPRELRAHIRSTYFALRTGMAALALALPWLLWIGGRLFAGLPLQASMSAYYHGGGGAMRDELVGILVAISLFLVLYRGFTRFEDWALNLAGLLLAGVALVPMPWDCGDSCGGFSLHGAMAVLFFLTLAYVCIFRASDTLGLIPDRDQARRFRSAYRWLGAGMVASPLVAVILTFLLQPRLQARSTVFFVEAAGVYVFAIYWIVKSREIALTDSEGLALDGKLATRSYRAADLFKPISVDRA